MTICIAFDMDDTLYLEREYVRSGFSAVADAIALRFGYKERWFEYLWGCFCSGQRGNIFDLLLQEYPSLQSVFSVSELVAVYRRHKPKIQLQDNVQTILSSLKENRIKLALITDGPFETQRAKVESLKLEAYFHWIVLTGAWGTDFWKPHPRGFVDVMQALGVAPRQCVYIGDNPAKDFIGAKELGWTTVRLRLPGQLHYEAEPESPFHAPHFEFTEWQNLADWIHWFVGR